MRYAEIINEATTRPLSGSCTQRIWEIIAHVKDYVARDHLCKFFDDYFKVAGCAYALGPEGMKGKVDKFRDLLGPVRLAREVVPARDVPPSIYARDRWATKADIVQLSALIHGAADPHMREYLIHLFGQSNIIQGHMDPEVWGVLCTTGRLPRKQVTARMGSSDQFDKRFRPRDSDEGSLAWNEVPDTIDDHYIWSVDEDHRGLFMQPGRVPGANFYAVCEVPWREEDINRRYRWN